MARKREKREKADEPGAGGDARLQKFYIVLAAVGVVGLGAVGWAIASRAGGSAADAPVELQGVETDQDLFRMAEGMALGSPDAPVVVHEFSDYQCPWCQRFASDIKPLLVERYVETGRARLIYFDFPLVQIHPHAFLAARAARCAGAQDRFWPYHDYLFGQQSKWSGMRDATDAFIRYAEAVGLDREEFAACLRKIGRAHV